jgi:hypothetical protein
MLLRGCRIAAITPRVRSGLLARSRRGVRLCHGGSSFASGPPAEQEVLWPIAGGATLISGILLGSLWLRNDGAVARTHGWLQRVTKSGTTAENVTVPWLLRVALAFGVSQLPVDSLRLRQLQLGALSTWGAMLGSYDYEQQQLALAALCALLESDAALRAFRQESGWYDAVAQALPPLVHESSIALSAPDLLVDALSLSCACVSHPMFLHTPTDAWLWERILETSVPGATLSADAAIQWACLAAHACEKHEVAQLLLANPNVKLALVHLAEPDAPQMRDMWPLARLAEQPSGSGSGSGSGSDSGRGGDEDERAGLGGRFPSSSSRGSEAGGAGASSGLPRAADWWRSASAEELEVEYARLALHRLAVAAEGIAKAPANTLSDDDKEAANEPFTRAYLDHEPPPLPARPPPEALAEVLRIEEMANSIASVIYCAVGGLVWGGAVGALASARARRPMWKSALITSCGASLFEGLMRLKMAGLERARRAGGGGRGGGGLEAEGTGARGFGDDDGARRVVDVHGPPRYHTLRGFAFTSSADVAVSSLVLLAIIQPARAPMAFGGWTLGRLVMLTQEVEMFFEEGDDLE